MLICSESNSVWIYLTVIRRAPPLAPALGNVGAPAFLGVNVGRYTLRGFWDVFIICHVVAVMYGRVNLMWLLRLNLFFIKLFRKGFQILYIVLYNSILWISYYVFVIKGFFCIFVMVCLCYHNMYWLLSMFLNIVPIHRN